MPTLVSLQVMLMHPRRRLQVGIGAIVIFCILSYVIISPNKVNKEPEHKELFAPGPTKEFLDFEDADFKSKKDHHLSRSSSIATSTSSRTPRKIQTRKRFNNLNGVPLGKVDDFDVIGGLDLFRHREHLDDRYTHDSFYLLLKIQNCNKNVLRCKSCKIINYGNACFMYKDFPFSQASFTSSEHRDVTTVVS